MAFQLDIELHIPDQIFETSQYFNARRAHLGDAVEAEIYALMDRIVETPFQFPKIKGEIRRALLKRFPLAIFFQVFEEKGAILLLDILPQASGNAERWPE